MRQFVTSRVGTKSTGRFALSERTPQNKLVHLTGSTDWIGWLIDVHLDYAGPHSLRGSATVCVRVLQQASARGRQG
jgi:hypothetical protein